MRSPSSIIALACLGCVGSPALATAVFNISGGVTSGNPGANAILDSVAFGGQPIPSSMFIRVQSAFGFTTDALPGEIRIESGLQTSGATGFHKLEASDGDSSGVSGADKAAFNARIRDAFGNANLNNYLDINHDGRQFSFTIQFARPVVDSDSSKDDVGELLLFERGPLNANSYWLLQPTDASGKALGGAFLVRPNQFSGTAPAAKIQAFDAGGSVSTIETLGGAAIDISEAFGVGSVEFLRVTSATPGQNGFAGPGAGEDTAPDFKILAIPAPGACAIVAVGLIIALPRRRH